jgi:hypothetical protein
MHRWTWLVLTGALAVPSAAAEIFRCPQDNGMDRYQNFPCSIDSIASVSSASPSANTASRHGGASESRSAAMPVAAASAGRSANAGEPRVGMTEDEVMAIWGEPEERIEDEPREGRIETWRYGDGRSVRFSNKHRVLGVQR